MPKLAARISGFLIWLEMGRTRPQLGGQEGAPPNADAGGKLGNALSTGSPVDTDIVLVRKFLPSKFRESKTTLLKARTVLSAKEALNRVRSVGA